ncbi:MAG: LacI family DNA-binding transcriptional regulator [Armatimonadetes bacterium]|nr:LacI family DNA-binding transcriptional regulator [Armatimonadota bacterium]
MRVTQRDIARLANVSQATVSRVLSGDDRVESDIRDRVSKVIREQNYQPDVRAQSLRNRRTGMIGLVIKRPQGGIMNDPFYANLIASIVEQLAETEFHLCVDSAVDNEKHLSLYDEMLRSRRVDGLILVESEASDDRILKLQRDKFPFVLIGNPLHAAEVHSVDNDNVHASEQLTRHLIEQGYHRIAFLGAKTGITVSDDRIAGYQRALRGAQDEHLIFHSDFGSEAARETAREILSMANRPDAIVVLDDFMALGVSAASREFKLSVPRDLGIASFNDSSLCEVVNGGLTSVNLNIPEIVRLSVSQLLDIIDNRATSGPRRILVPSSLSIRNSSKKSEVML